LIVQGDHTVLVEVDSPRYVEARDELARFAELVKSPEHVHTYRISPLSVWNACAAGVRPEAIIGALREYSKFPVPVHVDVEIRENASRYGRLQIVRGEGEDLILRANDLALAEEVGHQPKVAPYLLARLSEREFLINPLMRGRIKVALIKVGLPAEDVAGYVAGEDLPFGLRDVTAGGAPFRLRLYQSEAADAFHQGGSARGGSGVIVLPCGAGKTIVGMAAMTRLQTSTLILTTSVTASEQWARELLDKTTLTDDLIAHYNGHTKNIRPVTIATYNIMTWRPNRDGEFVHLELFNQRNWGLIIYDEVHLLPAPVFQVTAGLQARRRLGLTATLVREDGLEDEVFALIGPKKTDVPWKALERQGWIATATCTEIRLPFPDGERLNYAIADERSKFRIAAENSLKFEIVEELLRQHAGEPTLIIGMYVEQVNAIARRLGVPVLTGATPQRRRDQLYDEFRSGRLRVLAVSKVANFAVDLPDASVAIQISGTYGSRQEEAQRLGRILRPKPGANQAHFYTLVTRDTNEQDFAHRRQLFLCEQGYKYDIVDVETPNGRDE
jgi:DNA excision repair protein ERCC-3